MKSVSKIYEGRVATLKRRRDFLDKRVADYQGKDMSRDLAEASALHWALAVIEGNYEHATNLIIEQKQDGKPLKATNKVKNKRSDIKK